MIPLSSSHEKWKLADENLRKTVPNAKIQKIEMIQNRRLWKNFFNEKEALNEKWNEWPKSLYLWHGTRANNPKNIYGSEEGFDMRFSSGGMWGPGVYFAVNASYSNGGYAFNPSPGVKQMFFAEVIIGKEVVLNPDNSLKMPPLFDGDKRYDSIQGLTGGSNVYMIYTNKKAYPTFLVSYTDA